MLNKQDFLTAMEFLEEGTTMNLYCYSAHEIPYLRRILYQTLGEPDRTDGYLFKYPKFTIQLLAYTSTDSIGAGNGFYVAREDGFDWTKDHDTPPFVKYLWFEVIGLCDADVDNWLIREGLDI